MTENQSHTGADQRQSARADTADSTDESFRAHVAKLRAKRREKGLEQRPARARRGDDGTPVDRWGDERRPRPQLLGDNCGRRTDPAPQAAVGSADLAHEVRQLRAACQAQPRPLTRIAAALEGQSD